MMTLEQFLSGDKPKSNSGVFLSIGKKVVPGKLDDTWKEWYFPLLETLLCYFRDQPQSKAIIKCLVCRDEPDKIVKYNLSAEQMCFVAGYLRTLGFTITERFSILNSKDISIEVSWRR